MRLGAFEIDEKLAEGGMGEVWSGTHVATDTPVVAKVLTGRAARHPRFLELFQIEVQATARLEHPNVISVFDFGTLPAAAHDLGLTAGSPYYVMELVSGGSLIGQPWNYNALRNALLGTLSGLAHSHARGILHLDMKPGNVLWSAENSGLPRIVVTDFGLARTAERIEGLDDETESLNAGAAGTPAYMSPEQFMGAFRDFVPATDLYAVGIMAFEFVTGELPFAGSNLVMLAHQHQTAPLPTMTPRFETPEGFEAWVQRLTEKAPGHRFATAAEAARALRALGEVTSDVAALPSELAEAETLDSYDTPTLITATPPLETSTYSVPASPTDAPIPEDWREVSERWLPTRWMPPGRDIVQWKTPQFVARETERDALWAGLKQTAEDRRARAIVLRGELGTGKTRLGRWLQELVRLGGYARTAAAYHQRSNPDAHGLGGMLSDYYRCQGLRRESAEERLRDVLAHHDLPDLELEALFDLVSKPVGDDAVRSLNAPRVQICRRALTREASAGPLVVLLDDLQWAPTTVELMKTLVGQEDTPVLLVGTFRDDAPEAITNDTVASLCEEPFVDLVQVDNLLPGDALTLARDGLSLTGRVARLVMRSTNGNPLRATELVKHWLQNGELRCEDNVYVLTTDTPTMPDDLEQLWARSLAAMVERLKQPRALAEGRIAIPATEDAIRTRVEVAAALGVRVSLTEWAAACNETGAGPVFGLIDELVKTGFCTATDDGFEFEHGLVRDALVEISIESGRWPAINRAIATAIEALHDPSTRGLLGRLCTHYLLAGAYDQAERLMADALHRQAVFGYSTAQELAQAYDKFERSGIDLEDPRWIDLWLMRGELLAMSAETEENQLGLEMLDRALAHARSGSDPVKLGQALRFHGWCQVFGGDIKLGIAELEESLRLLTGHFEESLSATFLSLVHQYDGNMKGIEETAVRGLATARSPIQDFYAHQMLSYVADDYESALEHLATCRDIAQTYQLPDAMFATIWGLGDAHFDAGEFEQAAAEYQAYYDLCLFTGRNDRYAMLMPESLGRSLALAGRYSEALPHLMTVHQSLLRGEASEGAGPADAILLCAAMLGDSALVSSVFEEATRPPEGAWRKRVIPVLEHLLEQLPKGGSLRLRLGDKLAVSGWADVPEIARLLR